MSQRFLNQVICINKDLVTGFQLFFKRQLNFSFKTCLFAQLSKFQCPTQMYFKIYSHNKKITCLSAVYGLGQVKKKVCHILNWFSSMISFVIVS